MLKSIACTALLILLAPHAFAQSDDTSIFDILEEDQKVSLGAAVATTVKDSPTSVWIITRDMIAHTAALSVVDLLRLIPGLAITEMSSGYSDTNSRFPAVFPDRDMLFLIDGHSVLLNAMGFVDKQGLPISLDDIERIEVVEGPSSTLYGSSAVNGVVNIITRPIARAGDRLRASTNLGLGTGKGGDLHTPYATPGPLATGFAEYSAGRANGGFRLSVGGDYIPSFDPGDSSGPASHNPDERLGGTLTGEYDVQKWQLRGDLSSSYHAATVAVFQLAPLRISDTIFAASADRRDLIQDGDALSLGFYFRHADIRDWLEAPSIGNTVLAFRENAGQVSARYSFKTFYKNQLVAGAQVLVFSVDDPGQIAYSGQPQQLYTLYAEDNYRPLPQLIFTAGLRLETREGTGFKPFSRFIANPRLSVVWLPANGHSLRLEFATSYRDPGPFENFVNIKDPAGETILAAEPNLQAEQLMTLTLGYQGQVGRLNIRVEGYLSRYTNFIFPTLVPTTSSQTTVNGIPVGAVDFSGTKLPWVFANQSEFLFPGALAKLETSFNRYVEGSIWYTFMPFGSQSLAGLTGRAHWSRFNVSSQLYYQDQQNLGFDNIINAARLILNVFVSYALDERHRFEILLAGTNLIDARFFDAPTRLTRYYDDFVTWERIGPRGWLGLRIDLER